MVHKSSWILKEKGLFLERATEFCSSSKREVNSLAPSNYVTSSFGLLLSLYFLFISVFVKF